LKEPQAKQFRIRVAANGRRQAGLGRKSMYPVPAACVPHEHRGLFFLPVEEVITMTMKIFFRAARVGALAMGCLTVGPSFAYDADYFGYLADSNMHNLMLNQISRNAEMTRQLSGHKSGGGAAAPRPGAVVSTRVPLRARPAIPARLAAQYPQSSRPDAERALRQLLAAYSQVERHFGIPQGDLAGPIAAYIAGSYVAYRDIRFPNDNFRPLVTQVRNIISASPALRRASAEEKQDMYEQLAIMSIWMMKSQQSLRQAPNPAMSASLKQAGKDGLEKFLNIGADRIRIGAQGMQVH
jgi:hypothetical protein